MNKKQFHIPTLASTLDEALQNKINNKTKPIGSLGELESLALQLGRIQQTVNPVIEKANMLVFAADHGVVAQNVSPFPQEVTQQMVFNFLAGGAAVSVFCQQHNVPLRVVDVGVKGDFANDPLLSKKKIADGTADFSQQAAMSQHQYQGALQTGVDEVNLVNALGSNLVLFGEMGIGNTTTAACLMSCITGFSPESCVGPGTGSSPEGIEHKAQVIHQTQQRIKHDYRHNSQHDDCLSQLDVELLAQECGGFEIVAMAGAMLRSAELNIAFVVDGFICSVAFLIAQKINHNVREFAIFAHQSKETAHKLLLEYLNVTPLLSIGLRLGEGSGAILVLPIIQSAALFMKNMASFDSASVSKEK